MPVTPCEDCDNVHAICESLATPERQVSPTRFHNSVHNAAAGWNEDPRLLRNEPQVITVSHAAASELRQAGCRAACIVVHHIPLPVRSQSDARTRWRARWAMPADACVIGMIGAVKPQKAYTHALRLLAALLKQRDMWLVIAGGPVGRDGLLTCRA